MHETPGNRVQELPRAVALGQQPAAGQHEPGDGLGALERRGDGMLGRHVGAQPHVGEHREPLEVALGVVARARDDCPAAAKPGQPARLGEPAHGHAEHVGRERGGHRVHGVVVEDAVVDLVGEEHQAVARRDVSEPAQELWRVDRPGGVVRVDHHQRARAGRDSGLDVCEVGQPAALLVAAVVQGPAAAERGHRRPERVVGRRDQDLVTVVQQRLERHLDELGHAVSDVHIGHVDVLDAAAAVVVHDRLARREEAAGVAVSDRGGEVPDHVAQQVVRPLEPERRGVPDVQLHDGVALALQPQGLLEHRPAHVVGDAGELA